MRGELATIVKAPVCEAPSVSWAGLFWRCAMKAEVGSVPPRCDGHGGERVAVRCLVYDEAVCRWDHDRCYSVAWEGSGGG